MRRLEPAAITGVMSREVANFRTFWKATTFSSVLEPIVYLLAFGVGLGATIVDQVDGLDYVEFVGTGMVATAVIFSSALPAMFGTFVKHRFQGTYDAILAAPVDVEELVTAEMLWIGLRAGFYGCFPLLVSMFFGLDPAWGMLLVPFFCLITALGFAAFGIAVAGTVAKIDQFNYVTTLVITPLFLVAGTFFPIDQLPEGLQLLANLNPLYQLVELVRHASFGFETTDLLRVAALIAFSTALWRLAVRQMTAGLSTDPLVTLARHEAGRSRHARGSRALPGLGTGRVGRPANRLLHRLARRPAHDRDGHVHLHLDRRHNEPELGSRQPGRLQRRHGPDGGDVVPCRGDLPDRALRRGPRRRGGAGAEHHRHQPGAARLVHPPSRAREGRRAGQLRLRRERSRRVHSEPEVGPRRRRRFRRRHRRERVALLLQARQVCDQPPGDRQQRREGHA